MVPTSHLSHHSLVELEEKLRPLALHVSRYMKLLPKNWTDDMCFGCQLRIGIKYSNKCYSVSSDPTSNSSSFDSIFSWNFHYRYLLINRTICYQVFSFGHQKMPFVGLLSYFIFGYKLHLDVLCFVFLCWTAWTFCWRFRSFISTSNFGSPFCLLGWHLDFWSRGSVFARWDLLP